MGYQIFFTLLYLCRRTGKTSREWKVMNFKVSPVDVKLEVVGRCQQPVWWRDGRWGWGCGCGCGLQQNETKAQKKKFDKEMNIFGENILIPVGRSSEGIGARWGTSTLKPQLSFLRRLTFGSFAFNGNFSWSIRVF